jgi:hypothetical protein
MQSVEKVGKLCKSHVIPKYMLKHSKDKGMSIVIEAMDKEPRVMQFDWKEEMLCSSCENRIKFYEDFMNETFFLHRKNKVFANNSAVKILHGSNNLMGLGMISIFWRAVQAKMNEFQFAVAPEYVSSDMRYWLLMRTVPLDRQKYIHIKIEQIVDDSGKVMPFVVTPFVRPLSDKFEFVFAFAGYLVTFTLPPNTNESARYLLRQGSNYIRIRKIPFFRIPEIVQFFNRGGASNL